VRFLLLPLAALLCIAQAPAGYNGIWYFNQPSKDQYVYKYSGGFATYPQQQSPIAIYAPAVHKTFFCYGGARPGEQRLLQMVSYYDHKTGKVPRPTMLIDKATEDAHDNPVLSIDDKGHIWIFSNAHGTTRPAFIHRSKKPYDVAEFDLVTTTNFSYGHPWYVPGQGFLFLHTIYADKGRGLRWSTSADGHTWSEAYPLARIELGHYQITAHAGARTASVFNMHPAPIGLNARTNLYYVETADMGRTWKTVDGKTVQTPLTEKRNPALVHDYQSEGRLVYLKEVAFNHDGHPVILYMTSAGYESGPKSDPHIWHTARWTGTQWEIREVTRSDHNYDFGALWIEPDKTWRIIAPTLPGPIPYTTGGDMVMWTSKDQGQSWRSKRLTQSTEFNHTYARKPVNAHRDFYALWADGHTLHPSDSSLYFTNQSGTRVYRLPRIMTSEFAKPERVQ
jgi:hypothetical protein